MDNTQLDAQCEELLKPLHRFTPYFIAILVAVIGFAVLVR